MNHVSIRHDLFGLTRTPFVETPKTPFVDDARQQALDNLARFIDCRGFAVVAGRPGVGKTALVRAFTDQLHEPAHHVIYQPYHSLSENDLLKALCTAFGIQVPHRKSQTIQAIHKRVKELASAKVVLVLDEMQNATPAILEAVRALGNHDFDRRSQIACILIGTTEFIDKLRLAINESLRQRITAYILLTELDEPATHNYLKHILADAGAQHDIFEPPAVKLIHDAAAGAIRTITQLARAAMTAASHDQSPTVTLQHVQHAQHTCILPKPEVFR